MYNQCVLVLPSHLWTEPMWWSSPVFCSHSSATITNRGCDVTWWPRNSVISITWPKKKAAFWWCNVISSCWELPHSCLGISSSGTIQHCRAKWPSPNLLVVHKIIISDLSFLLTDSNNFWTVVVYTIETGVGAGGGFVYNSRNRSAEMSWRVFGSWGPFSLFKHVPEVRKES